MDSGRHAGRNLLPPDLPGKQFSSALQPRRALHHGVYTTSRGAPFVVGPHSTPNRRRNVLVGRVVDVGVRTLVEPREKKSEKGTHVKKRFLAVFLLGNVALLWSGNTKFGHRAYPVTSEKDLVLAGTTRSGGKKIYLRRETAEAWRSMVTAAHKEGVGLVPISGHRTKTYQKNLFDRAQKRYGSAQAAARWVAPPGFSEHHTGYTLDLGDESRPETDVETSFEGTPAFAWLQNNAATFGFELSFPKGNPQGVSHEPWHWRYVGTNAARDLFQKPK